MPASDPIPGLPPIPGLADEIAVAQMAITRGVGRRWISPPLGQARHVDLVPLFRPLAEEWGIRCSLKPIAEHVLGMKPIENIDPASIHLLPREELGAYLMWDLRATWGLAHWWMEQQLLRHADHLEAS